VYKKQSPNSRLTLYLSTREFVHATSRTSVSAIDGVVLVDPAYLKDRRVYAMVLLTFRYGREDEEVMGLKFFTEAILDFKQIYPPKNSKDCKRVIVNVHTSTRKRGTATLPEQTRLEGCGPRTAEAEPQQPLVQLGLSPEVGLGERSDEKPHKRNTVRMALRCVQYADFPVDGLSPTPPTASVRKTFFFCPGRLDLEAALDKETYHQGDMVRIHVTLSNGSSKTVQRLKVAVLQHVHVCMFTHGRFKNLIGSSDTGPSRPVPPGSTVSRDFDIRLQSCEKFPVALAIESEFHEEDPAVYSLSSTTVLINPKEKNPYGVNVSYEVKVKAILGCIDRPLVVRLPFRVMLPRPPEGVRRPTLPSSKSSLKVEDSLDPITDCVSEDIAKLGVSSSPHEVAEVS
ncbi:unnamed protein product, partial [Ixodes hexagonus]